MKKKKKVFICYRRADDTNFVKNLAKELKDWFEVSYDQSFEGGSITETIKSNINNCLYFIIVIHKGFFDFSSQKSRKDKEYIIEELYLATGKDHRHIIPIFMDDIKAICPIKPSNSLEPLSKHDEDIRRQSESILDSFFEKERFDLNGIRAEGDPVAFIQGLRKLMGVTELLQEQERKKKNKKILLGLIILFVSSICGYYVHQYLSSKTPKLVFAGGGSVANMIKKRTKNPMDILNYPNSLYLNMPSKKAWTLMAEEVMNNHTSDSTENKFYPICLSACKADKSDFLKIVAEDKFKKKGTVIEYYLGEDSLIIYTKLPIGKEGRVSISELAKTIKDSCGNKIKDTQKYGLYITQKESGTYSIYHQILNDFVNIDSCKSLNWYADNLTCKELPENYILLSSKYYTPDDIFKSRKEEKKVVMDEKGDVIKKPMYLYFVGYTSGEDDKYITIPEEMVDFLKKLDEDTVNIISKKMHQERESVITSFQTLKKWHEGYLNSDQ